MQTLARWQELLAGVIPDILHHGVQRGARRMDFFSRLKRDINIAICYLNRLRNTP